MTVSLDKIGLYAFLAVWVARRGKSSGRRLFFFLYLFFLACAVLFGNVSCTKTHCKQTLSHSIFLYRTQLSCLGHRFLPILSNTLGMVLFLSAVQISAHHNAFYPCRIESPTPWIYSQLIAANTGMSSWPWVDRNFDSSLLRVCYSSSFESDEPGRH